MEAEAVPAGALALGDGVGVWSAWAATDVPVTAAAVNRATTTLERRIVPAPHFFFSGAVFSGAVFSGPVLSGAVFSGPEFSGAVFSGAVFSGPMFSGAAGCGLVTADSVTPRGGSCAVRPARRASAFACARRANGLPPPPLLVPGPRLPALGLRTSSAPPAMISRPPSTINGMAHGVDVSFGKVIVMELGAGLVPSVASKSEKSPSAGASQV
ncbi:pentapeptide repeat-containing protein [Arthrobacter oryzae]|uniref:pentapeptide repeat-containing protein n=1 Tax=Arthrobacter oryzae TaxID=409290 RepID=UPI003CC6BECF